MTWLMSKIDPQRWRRIAQLMHQALDLAPEARRAFIEQIEDASIAQQLEHLLQAAGKPDALLDGDAASLLEGLVKSKGDRSVTSPMIQRHFGVYQADSPLGSGGMGQVFLGHRDDGTVSQQVAIKLLHTGSVDSGLRRRLLDEMQVLSTLEHPGIVRFIDGGVDESGIPYLIMEYCQGERIDAWCRRTRPSIERRLQLLIDICAAVEHAHQHLVVHRDIKPSNILVDEDGCPKLLDFGVAKVLQSDDLSDTGSTRIFSPGYAAPEQTTGTAITTATDVYALSVLLGELLWGQLPAIDPDAARLDPPLLRWRKRLKTGDTDALLELARRRRSGLGSLQRTLHGDLARIVAKGLRDEPKQRYHSARLLAEDLQNYLAHRPVLARHGGWTYRSCRFLRRNALASSLAIAATLGMISATGVALYQAQKARLAATEAGVEARRAGAVNDFLQSVFDAADPLRNQGKDIPVSQLLDLALARSKKQLKGDAPVRAAMLLSLGQVLDHVGRQEEAAGLLDDTLQLLPAGNSVPLDRAKALTAAGIIEMELSHLNQAEAQLREAVELTPMSVGLNSVGIQARIALAGFLIYSRNFPDQSMDLVKTLITRDREVLQLVAGSSLLGQLYSIAAGAHNAKGEYQSAIDTGLKAAHLQRQANGPMDVSVGDALAQVGMAYSSLSRFEDAEKNDRQVLKIFSKAYGGSHPNTLLALNQIGVRESQKGEFKAAINTFRRVADGWRKLYGDQHDWVATAISNIAEAQRQLGEYDDALKNYQEALDIHRKVLAEDDPWTGFDYAAYARVLGESGQTEKAHPLFETGLKMMRHGFGSEHPVTLRFLGDYGVFLVRAGRVADALPLLETARNGLLKKYAEHDIYPSLVQLYLGLAYANNHQAGKAREFLQTALPIIQAAGPKYRREAAEAKSALEKIPKS